MVPDGRPIFDAGFAHETSVFGLRRGLRSGVLFAESGGRDFGHGWNCHDGRGDWGGRRVGRHFLLDLNGHVWLGYGFLGD
jgi:hypothetical protein